MYSLCRVINIIKICVPSWWPVYVLTLEISINLEISIKITLPWADKQFATRVHKLFYIYIDANERVGMDIFSLQLYRLWLGGYFLVGRHLQPFMWTCTTRNVWIFKYHPMCHHELYQSSRSIPSPLTIFPLLRENIAIWYFITMFCIFFPNGWSFIRVEWYIWIMCYLLKEDVSNA